MEQLGKKANPQPIQPYSLSLLAGITKGKVLGIQLVEGGVDASVFDNFVYELLHIIRRDRRYNPVEKFFKYVKTKLRDQPSINK